MSEAKKRSIDALANEIADMDEVSISQVADAAVQTKAARDLNELQRRQTAFLESVRKEPKVDISVAPQYAAEFSNCMRVTINGSSIFIPIDGKTYKVPQTFADEIKRRIYKVNQKINRIKKKNNENLVVVEEKNIGEVKLF